MTCLMFVTTTAFATYTLGSVLSSIADRSVQKIQSTQMAEAGANAFYAQIAAGFDSAPSSPTWPTTLASTAVRSTVAGSTQGDGSYTAHIVNIPTAQTVSGKTVYTFVIEGDGVSPNGAVTSQVRTSFTETKSGGAGSTYSFPTAAIVTNGSVQINNGAGTVDSSGNNMAGIDANGLTSVYWGSTVSGPIQVASAELTLSQAVCFTCTVGVLSTPISLPSAAQVAAWQTAWQADSQQATTPYPMGNIQTSGSYSGTNTVTAPAYYSGNFTVNYGTTTLQPSATATSPSVLYIHGNLTLAGGSTLINNGVVIVCDGTVTAANGTNYVVTAPTASALIDLNSSPTAAVTLAGGTNAQIGLIYTPNGGVTLNNGATYTGSIISGSASSVITMAGGGKLVYQDGFASTVGFIPSSGGYTSALMTSYFREL